MLLFYNPSNMGIEDIKRHTDQIGGIVNSRNDKISVRKSLRKRIRNNFVDGNIKMDLK